MSEPVLVREQRGAVLVLRLNRPEARNALNMELLAALGSAVSEAEADPGTRAVVLTGTGDRAFCAGMGLAGFAAGEKPTAEQREGIAAFTRFTKGETTVPIVGAANAAAVAGGFEVALQATKELVRLAVGDVERAWERQGEWQPRVFGSEGATAFIEKGEPVWRGR